MLTKRQKRPEVEVKLLTITLIIIATIIVTAVKMSVNLFPIARPVFNLRFRFMLSAMLVSLKMITQQMVIKFKLIIRVLTPAKRRYIILT